MKQYEQVIKVMKENGGFSTLGFLNHNVDVSGWKTKTPYASIRRIVQEEKLFFRIKPGLWALKEQKKKVLNNLNLWEVSKKQEQNFNHYYFQGLLLELGNIKGFDTYVPAQDSNKYYLDRKLKEVSTLDSLFEFSYSSITKRAKTVDVIWFNDRKLPNAFFEVEHTTDMQNSLSKFNDLQDFYAKFYIASAKERKKEYDQKIAYSSFRDIKERVTFIDYEYISKLHSKSFELLKLKSL